jgi:hypothetical protein
MLVRRNKLLYTLGAWRELSKAVDIMAGTGMDWTCSEELQKCWRGN